MPTLLRTVLPPGLVLCLASLAERAGAESAAYYLFLAGIPVAAVGALAALARLVDSGRGRGEAVLAAALVACFAVGAAARSPLFLEAAAPAVVPVALGLGFGLVALLAASAAAPSRR